MDNASVAPHPDNDHDERPCFYCLEGWVFLGSIDHDGEETTEAIRCRRCKGSGILSRVHTSTR